MVDRLLELHTPKQDSRMGRCAKAIKNVSFNEPFFQGHFPGEPIMPGVLVTEAMGQTAILAALRPDELPSPMVRLSRIKDIRFRSPVVPGMQLMIDAEVIKEHRGMLAFRVTVKDASQAIVKDIFQVTVKDSGKEPEQKIEQRVEKNHQKVVAEGEFTLYIPKAKIEGEGKPQ